MDILEMLRHSATLYGNKTAIDTSTQKITYNELYHYCLSFGSALHELGLKKGDRIAILDYNSLEMAAAHFAVPGCGMVFLPLNCRLAKAELKGILKDAGVSALIYSPLFGVVVDELKSELDFVTHFICTESRGHDHNLISLIESAPEKEYSSLNSKAPATLLYTSGTSGRPKGAKLSHGNLTAAITSLLIETGFKLEDVGVMVMPLFHISGCSVYMAAIATGCTVTILPKFDPEKTLTVFSQTKATFTILVPAMISALLIAPGIEKTDFSNIRLVLYAGAPMSPAMLEKAIHRFGNVFFQIYGLTETSLLTKLRVEDHEHVKLLASCGREFFGSRIKLVNEKYQEIGHGEVGQIIAKGDNIISEYWNAPKETQDSFKDGWFLTGDTAYRDENGYIFLKDRQKDMIVSGGENIYSIEVENVIYRIPEVLEAAVIGIPDEKWGEKVIAQVHLQKGQNISQEEVIEYCKEHLAGFKCPKEVIFNKEPLPRTASGKVRKNILREPYWKGKERRIN